MTASPLAWLDHPLAEAMLQFNFLPSRLAHASRLARWTPPTPEGGGGAELSHRQASAALLEELGLGWVEALDDPALALCLPDEALFARLVESCGLALLGPAVRRCITRAEVQALQAQLGEEGLRFARQAGLRFWTSDAPPVLALESDRVRDQAVDLGGLLLDRAFQDLAEPVARRARLRLSADLPALALPHALDEPAKARALAQAVLQEIAPEWLSLFPARH